MLNELLCSFYLKVQMWELTVVLVVAFLCSSFALLHSKAEPFMHHWQYSNVFMVKNTFTNKAW